MKSLIITEKPSVARDIAKVLGCKTKRDGYIEGDLYVVTWAVGHLITLCEPDDYNEAYKKWHYNSLPIIPEEIKTKPYPKTKSQLSIIKSLIKREDVSNLICATDSGREGELIFRYIYEYLKSKKPFQRLWISSMTDEAIKKGFETLKPSKAYDNLYYSAKCRSEADWLVGINATRAYTTLNNVLLSIGRVQTPTLALIVNRHHEITDFVPKDYFEVVVNYGQYTGIWFDEKPSETKIMDEEKALLIKEKVHNQDGTVIKVEKKKKTEKPPLLYDLTELQRDGNKMYGYSAQEVLTYAQNLYERYKLLTYPRTDSRYLSDDMKDTVKETMAHINIPPYDKAIKSVLDKGLKFSKRIIDNSKVTDHHAIIPTNLKPNTSRLPKEEMTIYNLVVKRFIAVFYPDFTYEITSVIVDIEKETFASKGKIIIQKGWKSLYKADKDDKDEELPPIKKNDIVHVQESEIQKKQTSPPKPYTEGTLLSAMENAGRYVEDEELKEQLKEAGFGTPATRASIIERLIQVKYIYRKGKSLHPTEKGIKLIKIVPDELKLPETTGKWEKGLNKISKGELESDKFMKSINRFVVYIVKEADKNKNSVVFEKENYGKGKSGKGSGKGRHNKSLGNCPKCKTGTIHENSKGYYCSNWQQGCNMTIWKNQLASQDIDITPDLISKLLSDQFVEIEKGNSNYRLGLTEQHALAILAQTTEK